METLFKIRPNNFLFKNYWSLVEEEFSQKIPWFKSIDFADIFSYVFLEYGKVIGGITLFNKSPESEPINREKINLIGDHGLYASCLILKKEARGVATGEYLRKIFKKICYNEKSYLWGVTTELRLAKFYKINFSAKIIQLAGSELFLIKLNQ